MGECRTISMVGYKGVLRDRAYSSILDQEIGTEVALYIFDYTPFCP